MTKRESNILKCVAIMLMLCHHLFMYADQPDYPALVYGPLLSNPWRLASLGQLSKLCVTLFVFVTAYGTAKSYMGDGMGDENRLAEKSIRRLVKLLVNFQFVYIIAFALCPLGGEELVYPLQSQPPGEYGLRLLRLHGIELHPPDPQL